MEKSKSGISQESLALIRRMQQTEITEWATYQAIAGQVKDAKNREVLLRLAQDEHRHAQIWEKYTGERPKPNRFLVFRRKLSAILLGYTFTVKQMENGEEIAQGLYEKLAAEAPESAAVRAQEEAHEQALLEILDEERLQYVGSMVLGLNDALVELTGTLAGLTLAMQNTRLIALSGLITGVSATLSMASSEFLSAKSDGRPDALKSCVYTGIAYLITVTLLILPYLIFPAQSYLWALGVMLAAVVVIIVVFNYYVSVAKGLSFRKRFGQMALISLGVAALSFVVGLLVKHVLGVDL